MPALVIKCKRTPYIKVPPQLHLPGFGVFRKLGTAIDEIPDGSQLLGEFMDDLAQQLAPFTAILEIVEAIMAVYNCIKGIAEAIPTLDAAAVFDCLQKLVRAITLLFGYIPPLGWIRTAVDIAAFSADLIEEIFKVLTKMDQKLTAIIATYEEAQQLADGDLEVMSECAAEEVAWLMDKIMQLVQFVKQINDPLMGVLKRTLPGGNMKIQLGRAQNDYDEATKYLEGVESAISKAGSWVGIEIPDFKNLEFDVKEIHDIVPVPQLEPVMAAINTIRSACVIIHNGLAPMVGVPPNKTIVGDPVYRNF